MRKILTGAALIAALTTATVTNAAEAVLRAVSGHPANSALGSDFKLFMDMVNEAGKGIIQIRLMGGPEVTPPSQQGAMLSNGLTDLLHISPIWYAGRFPEGEVFSAKIRPAAEIRAKGGDKIYDQLLRKKMNAAFVAFADGDGGLYVFTTNKPGQRADGLPDLTGIKLRGTTISQEFLSRLGAGTVVLPPAETYTALERGMVTGAVFPIGDAYDLGWHKQLKYVITPPPFGGSTIIAANAAKLDSLSEEAKAVLAKTSIEYEKALVAKYQKNYNDTMQKLAAAGVQEVQLAGDLGAKWRNMAAQAYRSYLQTKTFDLDLDSTLKILAGQ